MEPEGGFDFKERLEFSPMCFKSTIVQVMYSLLQIVDFVGLVPLADLLHLLISV